MRRRRWPFSFHTGVSSPVSTMPIQPKRLCTNQLPKRLFPPAESSASWAQRRTHNRQGCGSAQGCEAIQYVDIHGRRRGPKNKKQDYRKLQISGDTDAVATGDAQATRYIHVCSEEEEDLENMLVCLICDMEDPTLRREIWTRKTADDWMVDRALVRYESALLYMYYTCT